MSEEKKEGLTNEEPAEETVPLDLSPTDLEDVAGGGPLYDTYLIIKDGWSDFKEGFSDAMND